MSQVLAMICNGVFPRQGRWISTTLSQYYHHTKLLNFSIEHNNAIERRTLGKQRAHKSTQLRRKVGDVCNWVDNAHPTSWQEQKSANPNLDFEHLFSNFRCPRIPQALENCIQYSIL